MNINAFSNMDTFDLSGSFMPTIEGAETNEDFSGLLAEFTTMLAPALISPPVSEPCIADFAIPLDDNSTTADLTTNGATSSPSPFSILSGDGDPLSTTDFIFGDGPVEQTPSAYSWADRFGIERIKAQILDGVIEPPKETAGGLTGSFDPDSSDPGLWSGVIDGKIVDGPEPVKNGPRLPPIVPGETPPIVIFNQPAQTTTPTKDFIVPDLKRPITEPPPVGTPVKPISTGRLEGPPLVAIQPAEPVFEPTGVNEAPDVLTTRLSTDGSTKVPDGSVFLGPPQESTEPVPQSVVIAPSRDRTRIRGPLDVFPETGGIKPIRETVTVYETDLPVDLDAPEPLAIKLTPKFDGARISGFEIKPDDLENVIKTFEAYLKPEEKPVRNITPAPAQPVSGTFEAISDSIRRSLDENVPEVPLRPAGIQKAAETIAEIRPMPAPFGLRMKPESTSVGKRDVSPDELISVPTDKGILASFTGADETVVTRDRMNAVSGPDFVTDFRARLADRDAPELNADSGPETLAGISNLRSREVPEISADLAAQAVSPKRIVEQVASHLLELSKASFANNERPSIKLRLNPRELGTVEVMIERNESGGLNATFRTETSAAQQALSQNLDSLRDTLQNAGWQVGKMDVSTGSDLSGGNQQPQQQNREQSNTIDFVKPADAALTDSRRDVRDDHDDRLINLLA